MICLCLEKAVRSSISMSLQRGLWWAACTRTQQGASAQLTHIEQKACVSPSPVIPSPPTAMTHELGHTQTAPALIRGIMHSKLLGCIWLKPMVHKEVGWDSKWFTMQIWHNHNSGSAPLWKQRRRHVKNWCGLFYQAEKKKKKRWKDQERGKWRRKSVWVCILKRCQERNVVTLTCVHVLL